METRILVSLVVRKYKILWASISNTMIACGEKSNKNIKSSHPCFAVDLLPVVYYYYHPWQETLRKGQSTHKHTYFRKLIAALAA
jgi:hypothetical protein